MKTIKETHVDRKTVLRLVHTGTEFVGFAIADGATKLRIRGESADDVWRRLHYEVAKATPNMSATPVRGIAFYVFSRKASTPTCMMPKSALQAARQGAARPNGSPCGCVRKLGLRRSNISGLPGDEPAIAVRKSAPAERAPRTFDRPLHSRRSPVQRLSRTRLRLTATGAKSPTMVRKDSGDQPVVPLAAGGAHVSMFLKPEVTRLRSAGRASVRIGLRAAPLARRASKSPRSRRRDRGGTGGIGAPRPDRRVQRFIWVVGDYKDVTETPKP
jgi:hypothetical protein